MSVEPKSGGYHVDSEPKICHYGIQVRVYPFRVTVWIQTHGEASPELQEEIVSILQTLQSDHD